MERHLRPRTRSIPLIVAVLLFGVVTACGTADDGVADPGTRTDESTVDAGSGTKTSDVEAETRSDELVVTDVWARPSTAGGTTAVYLTVQGGPDDDELIAVRTEDGFANSAEMHETLTVDSTDQDDAGQDDAGDGDHRHGGHGHDGHGHRHGHDDRGHGPGGPGHEGSGSPMLMMEPVDEVPIPAGERVEFTPGGLHIMVMGLGSELVVGEEFPITFTFAGAGARTATATVREQ